MENIRAILQESLEQQKIIEIIYKDLHNNISKRIILPLRWDGRLVIVAYCFLRKDERHFRVSGIDSISPTVEYTPEDIPMELRGKEVVFPKDIYFGEMFIIENINTQLLIGEYKLSTNLGKVIVPAKKNLLLKTRSLRVNTEWIHPNLSPLREFRPDDLQALEVDFPLEDKDLANIQNLTDIMWLKLDIRQISNMGLNYISRLNGLKYLFLYGSSFETRPNDISAISELHNIEWLSFIFGNLNDESFFHFRNFEKLRLLDLSENKHIHGKGLNYIKNKNNLEHLELTGTNIDNAGMLEIIKFTNLRSLLLNENKNPHLTQKGFQSLESLRNLTTLFICDTNLNDNGMQKICNLTDLKVLDVSRTNITDDGLMRIDKLQELVQLQMSNVQITDKSLGILAKLPNLQYLSIQNKMVTRKSLIEYGLVDKLFPSEYEYYFSN
jgi:hypothetical protein